MADPIELYQVVQYLMTLNPHAKVYIRDVDLRIRPLEKHHIIVAKDHALEFWNLPKNSIVFEADPNADA
jgi:hypothetical protein